jgi:hypothetical protein
MRCLGTKRAGRRYVDEMMGTRTKVGAWARRTAMLLALWIGARAGLQAQAPGEPTPDSALVVPGARYEASGLHSWLLGKGHRDIWTVPMRAEVADLSRLGGGLTPLRLGGGMTTRTLHLEGADGHRYVFRSVEKYVAQGLPEELHRTLIEAALQDQISAFHPTGAPVVAALLDALRVLHTSPRFFVVPEDPRLGEFRDFAGTLVLFEERPDSGWSGAGRVISTPDLFERLDEHPTDRVDAREYLAIRLVDLWIGDRDRSVNNWDWAEFGTRTSPLWRPVPRDRDQAFVKLNGVIKGVLRSSEPRLVDFDDGAPPVVGLTRSAWDVDRRILTQLQKSSWDSVTTAVAATLTDSVIDAAVRRLPAEHYRAGGAELARALKARRQFIPKASNHLYRLVAEYADVHASDQPDVAEVEHLDDDRIAVRLFTVPDEGRAASAQPYFERVFHRDETKEIRVYLKRRPDRAVVRGSGARGILTRIVGGDGADELVDSSTGRARTLLYDGGDSTRFVTEGGARVIRRHAPPRELWGTTAALPPDWGSRRIPRTTFAFNGDVGLLIGGGTVMERYGFLKTPYQTRVSLSAAYATRAGLPVLDYLHELKDVAGGRADLSFHARWSGIEVLHFHGFGNDTEVQGGREFHRVDQRLLSVTPAATIPIGHSSTLSVGPRFTVSVTDTTAEESSFLSTARPYGSGTFTQLGARAGVRIETRDRGTASGGGWLVLAGGSFHPGILDQDRGSFGEVSGAVTTYLSADSAGDHTAALRIGGKKVFGTAPFYEAAFIGGLGTVRGLRAERFAGSAAAYANLELRSFVAQLHVIVPVDFGVFGLLDAGRVFQPGESSRTWHTGVGGGIWLAPLRRTNTLSLALARSSEGAALYLTTGFMY